MIRKANFDLIVNKAFVMKNLGTLSIIVCLLSCATVLSSCDAAAPAELTDQDRAFFQKVTVDAYESFSRDDREPYVNRYAEDAIFMAPNMEAIIGKEAIKEYVYTYPRVRLEFPIVEIIGTGSHANVRGTFVINDPDGNFLDKGKYISVWQKDADGNWQLTHDIFNSDTPVPTVAEEVITEE